MNSSIRQLIRIGYLFIFTTSLLTVYAQEPTPVELPVQDTIEHPVIDTLLPPVDTTLRIRNLNPFFTLHVDSSLAYQLEINKNQENYYWFLRNSPVGLRVNKDNGLLTFKAEKTYFMQGRLKYDTEYRVNIGVQNLNNPFERIDTSFTLLFYNTEILASKLKPTISPVIYADEGDTVAFKVQCENGTFPIENITFFSNASLTNFSLVKKCDDEFKWSPNFDFVKETDSAKVKVVVLNFIGATRFMVKDTATIKIIVRDALNYPMAEQEYALQIKNLNSYLLQLKYTFLYLDKNVKRIRTTRTTFDITGSTTALTGSILSSSSDASTQKTGKVMPSVGVSLVPIKEAVAPQKVFDQNQASMIRSSIKRLEYIMRDNALVGDRDPDITKKTDKLKEELRQMRMQLIDVPLEVASSLSEEELNEYFNSDKVSKKYRLRK